MSAPHVYGSCHFEDCPACERIAETGREEFESDPYGWSADAAAELYERMLDERWGG